MQRDGDGGGPWTPATRTTPAGDHAQLYRLRGGERRALLRAQAARRLARALEACGKPTQLQLELR